MLCFQRSDANRQLLPRPPNPVLLAGPEAPALPRLAALLLRVRSVHARPWICGHLSKQLLDRAAVARLFHSLGRRLFVASCRRMSFEFLLRPEHRVMLVARQYEPHQRYNSGRC